MFPRPSSTVVRLLQPLELHGSSMGTSQGHGVGSSGVSGWHGACALQRRGGVGAFQGHMMDAPPGRGIVTFSGRGIVSLPRRGIGAFPGGIAGTWKFYFARTWDRHIARASFRRFSRTCDTYIARKWCWRIANNATYTVSSSITATCCTSNYGATPKLASLLSL
jgi:hypothetical protein